jgi:cytochrome oxidase Cu insertion factor (SCO1/SenC/PrrC family)
VRIGRIPGKLLAMRTVAISALIVLAAGCARDEAGKQPTAAAPTAPTAPTAAAPSQPEAAPPAAAPTVAEVGQLAPDFRLKDLDGKEIQLASLRGKIVVLEWFNPQCPYVQRSHTKGSLVGTAKRHVDAGVAWLAINSGAPGKQGHDPAANAEALKAWGLPHSVLRDEEGTVGKTYGATNTPNMFVIDKDGKLVYRGAIDNSPDAEGGAPEGGSLINYVDKAIEAVRAGQPVAVPTTKPYGCGVKYAS